MAKVGAQRAAELTGRSKSTIQRAMNSGKISFEVSSSGTRVVDVAEIERVFGIRESGTPESVPSVQAVEAQVKQAADMIELERMRLRAQALEDKLETAREQIDDLRAQRDQWQKQAQQVLLTSQYSQKQAEDMREEIRERDRKEKARRQQLIEEKMRRMAGNQNRGHKEGSSDSSSAAAAAGPAASLQALWNKIRKRT